MLTVSAPDDAAHDLADVGLADAIGLGQGRLGDPTLGVPSADLLDLIGRQDHAGRPSVVQRVWDGFEMVGIYAEGVPTEVVDFVASRNRSSVALVKDPVSASHRPFLRDPDAAISIGGLTALPDPTSAGVDHIEGNVGPHVASVLMPSDVPRSSLFRRECGPASAFTDARRGT